MDYDPKKVKWVKRIINGKEYMVEVAPPGMHGPGYRPDLFRIGPLILPEDGDFNEDKIDLPVQVDDTEITYTAEDIVSLYERGQEGN